MGLSLITTETDRVAGRAGRAGPAATVLRLEVRPPPAAAGRPLFPRVGPVVLRRSDGTITHRRNEADGRRRANGQPG